MQKYQFEDFSSIRELYFRVWKERRGLDYDRIRLRDTYDGLPVAVVAKFKDETGGFFTIWPMPLTDGRQSVSGGQAMDVMTDERFRGKGVFPSLATQAAFDAAGRGMKVLYGVPNEAVLDTYIKRLAWATPAQVRTCVRPLSLRGKHPLLGIADPVLAALPSGSSSGFEMSTGRPADEFIGACLDGTFQPKGIWKVERSLRWYEFRYQANERFEYYWVYGESKDNGKAFAIWGLDKNEDGLRRANLMDFVGTSPLAKAAIVGAACRAGKRAGAAYMSATTTSVDTAYWLRRKGFIPFKKSPLIVKTLDPSAFSANPFQERSWNLFGGDFDFV